MGEPTLDTILLLHRQVKRNAQSIPTTLGGGQLGYLALVVPEDTYDSIPTSEIFIRPTDPGKFTLQVPSTSSNATILQTPPGPTRRTTRSATRSTSTTTSDLAAHEAAQTAIISSAEVATQKAAHDEATKRYYECQAVEQALRNQIIEAVEPEYLDALRNVDTDMINESIPEIFIFLQETYGRITEEELVEKEDTLRQLVYDPHQPVDKVFNKITLFHDLCTITNNDKTDKQLVQIAYLIFNRTRAFVDALKKWNELSEESKTYAKFKKHMRAEHHALKRVGALTVQDSTFYQANLLQQPDVQAQIDEQVKTSLLSALNDFQELQLESEDNNQGQETTFGVNNLTKEDNTTTALLNLIKQLTDKVDKLAQHQPMPSRTMNPKTGKP